MANKKSSTNQRVLGDQIEIKLTPEISHGIDDLINHMLRNPDVFHAVLDIYELVESEVTGLFGDDALNVVVEDHKKPEQSGSEQAKVVCDVDRSWI